MKISKAYISGFVSATLLIGGTVGTYAASSTIQALLNPTKIMYQGQALKDAKGVAYNTLTYKNTEYLPVSIIEKAGVPVNRGTDKNIYIDSTENEFKVNSSKFIGTTYIDRIKLADYMTFTKASQELLIEGVQYSYGFVTGKQYRDCKMASITSNPDRFANDSYVPHSFSTEKTTKSVISEMEATFYLDKKSTIGNFTNWKPNVVARDFELVGYTINKEGTTTVLSTPIEPGVPLKLSIPVDNQNIIFQIQPSNGDEYAEFHDLKLYILDPVFIK